MNSMERLVQGVLGKSRLEELLKAVAVDHEAVAGTLGQVTRGEFAMTLGLCLYGQLLDSVPSAADYFADRLTRGERVTFDHGAIRTVLFPEGRMGALPAGEGAFRRILEPLGYAVAGIYPLPRLRMTGRAYCHSDYPETIPQFFVSELHVDQFEGEFQAAAQRVFGNSTDPLGSAATTFLASMAEDGTAPYDSAAAAMPEILAAFGCRHAVPSVEDYEILLAESPEAAWIATEGNAFNHATDRVPDVEALAAAQRALGRPIKDHVEHSTNGRVHQTAFRAASVLRKFRAGSEEIVREVPGSFYEFITRDVDLATGRLDLSFDSGNATGIFKMTKVA